jgi:hypothetical protein
VNWSILDSGIRSGDLECLPTWHIMESAVEFFKALERRLKKMEEELDQHTEAA